MIKVCDLPLGWSLYAAEGPMELGGYVPVMKRAGTGDRTYTPLQLASGEGSRAVYYALARKLAIMDRTWKLPGEDPRFKAADAAVAVLGEALRKLDKWSDDLNDTGIEGDVIYA